MLLSGLDAILPTWATVAAHGGAFLHSACCGPEDIDKEGDDYDGVCRLFSKCQHSSGMTTALWNVLPYSTSIYLSTLFCAAALFLAI